MSKALERIARIRALAKAQEGSVTEQDLMYAEVGGVLWLCDSLEKLVKAVKGETWPLNGYKVDRQLKALECECEQAEGEEEGK